MTQKVWLYQPETEGSALRTEMPELDPLLVNLLEQRGMQTREDAALFLNPDPRRLLEATKLHGVEQAVTMITTAIQANDSIVIFGDYDVDGACSTALLLTELRRLGANVRYYIPDRNHEGYGLNPTAIRRLAEEGARLILTVDCGSTNHAEIDLAHELGMRVIVTDHHQLHDTLPQADVLINPHRADHPYAFPHLCGAGVAFKLLEGLRQRLGFRYENSPLDLVALATVADLVPLLGENRILVRLGLQRLQQSHRAGIKALLAVTGLAGKPVESSHVAFQLAPRLNAAGRLKHASFAVELLTTEDEQLAFELANELDQLNQQRRSQTDQMLSEAEDMIKQKLDQKVWILASPKWPAGLLGLVAGKLNERYHRVVLGIHQNQEQSRGSARSIRHFDVTKALGECADLLHHYGGHEQAAGLEMSEQHILPLEQALNRLADQWLSEEDMLPKLSIHATLDPEQINLELVQLLRNFAPFGMGNPRPVFASHAVQLRDRRLIGRDQTHHKSTLLSRSGAHDVVGFGLATHPILQGNTPLDIAYTLDINEWNGRRTLQLLLKDLALPSRTST